MAFALKLAQVWIEYIIDVIRDSTCPAYALLALSRTNGVLLYNAFKSPSREKRARASRRDRAALRVRFAFCFRAVCTRTATARTRGNADLRRVCRPMLGYLVRACWPIGSTKKSLRAFVNSEIRSLRRGARPAITADRDRQMRSQAKAYLFISEKVLSSRRRGLYRESRVHLEQVSLSPTRTRQRAYRHGLFRPSFVGHSCRPNDRQSWQYTYDFGMHEDAWERS